MNIAMGPPLETMTKEQLMEECSRWRSKSTKIIAELMVLEKFRKFAPTPEELNLLIQELNERYQAALALQSKQIEEMGRLITQMREDPLGIFSRFEKPIKTKLN